MPATELRDLRPKERLQISNYGPRLQKKKTNKINGKQKRLSSAMQHALCPDPSKQLLVANGGKDPNSSTCKRTAKNKVFCDDISLSFILALDPIVASVSFSTFSPY